MLETFPVGPFAANCYILASGEGKKSCIIIDPGDEAARIIQRSNQIDRCPELILLTHSHFDHIGAVDALLAAFPDAQLACSAETSSRIGDPRTNLCVLAGLMCRVAPAGRTLADGESFTAAGFTITATEIPGHDPGELVYQVEGVGVFTGDTVFAGGIGRSDFPGGNHALLVRSARKYLASLPFDTPLYPGHGEPTTAGAELADNPYLSGGAGNLYS